MEHIRVVEENNSKRRNSMKKKRLLTLMGSICLVLVLVALLLPACAKEEAPVAPAPAAKPIVWKFANFGLMVGPWNELPKWFFDEIETRSNGRLKCDFYVAEALVPIIEQPEALKAGVCQSTVFVPPYYFSKTPLSGFISYPFVMPGISLTGEKASSEDGMRVTFSIADEYYNHPKVQDELAQWDAMYISPHAITQYQMIGNKPLRTVEDIEGLKIKIGGPYCGIIEAFGGAPCPMSSGECYEALQKGTVDLWTHDTVLFRKYKLYEVSKYFIDDMFLGSTMSIFVTKLSAFQALPKDLQKVVLEVKSEAIAKFAATYYEENAFSRQVLREKGVEFIYFPATERNKMEAKAKEVAWPEWIEKANELGLPAQEMADWTLAEMKKAGW